MPFVVVYDACVLYPSHLRDLLIRLGQTDLVHPKWSNDILDEVFRSLRRNRPDLDPARLDRTRALMCASMRDVLVTNYEPLIESIQLPDADDRHVLAAAIRAHAQVIVTNNLKHFPPEALEPYAIEPQSADKFVRHLFDLDPLTFMRLLREMVRPFDPPMAIEKLLSILARDGLKKTVNAAEEALDDGL